MSSCEAEYVSLATATQEIKFLKMDNQGAIALAKNPVHHKRSKHIDVKYHYVRLEIQNRAVSLTYVPTDNNVADVFTKPETRVKLDRLLS